MGTRCGFTLMELLVVVAVVAILATIALPNFMEAQTRSKVARAHTDLKTLQTGAVAFSLDHGGMYPLMRRDFYGGDSAGAALGRLERLTVMTTPVAYLSAIPRDPFVIGGLPDDPASAPPNDVYVYWDQEFVKQMRKAGSFQDSPLLRASFGYRESGKREGVLLMSAGPDRAHGIDESTATGRFVPPEYDPTNGTMSEGQLYCTVVVHKSD